MVNSNHRIQSPKRRIPLYFYLISYNDLLMLLAIYHINTDSWSIIYMVQGNLDQWNLFTNQVNYIYTRNVAKINNKLDTNF